MGALVGLLLGAGLFCWWWACWAGETQDGGARVDARPSLRARAEDLLANAGLAGVPVAALGAACGACVLVVGLLALLVSGSPVLALLLGGGASWGPVAFLKGRARSRAAAVRELWPDAVDHLASGVRAGLSLPEALAALAVHGPEPLRLAFADFADDHRATGRFLPALDRLKDSLADPVADRVVEALRLTREVGGSDLGRVLRALSSFLRDDARTRGELLARQSWTVATARLAVAAPWVVLLLLCTRPGTVSAFREPAGALVLGGGAVCCVLAYAIMRRVGRLPEDQRVLR
ncbi:tight adherence protein B [Quadrisphaera granulorum]|uniref:Tight adherence protein B n=1 Tax=Quadrisphaera granulorum TaxID=317664 RepID=A0A316AC38_9ACTN|nr:type II secretion system F family protein [Quadrisphaera granulorum]PWJ54838.1 tight adherence protein B [Quadrisphaera granulorum]SZE95784.1 tight adherence protein B [Quadrisphaera granulorum]